MSEVKDEAGLDSSSNGLDARHRKEQRELQNRITQKKKQATKKTRKGVNDECEQLERELKDRQQRERDSLTGNPTAPEQDQAESIEADAKDEPSNLANATANLDLQSSQLPTTPANDAADDSTQPTRGKKPNRQKARLARRAAEQDAAAEQASAEASNMTDHKAEEQQVISAAIASHNLVEHRVRSDGHCLYAAMVDQLHEAGVPLDKAAGEDPGLADYQAVRQEVASWVVAHPDDYLPFLDEEDMAKGIEGYASRIRSTAEWGGQLEIAACARRWGLVVNVLQGDGRIEKIEGEGGGGRECWLAYYKHSFGLGEHYNSLRKKA